MSLNIVDLTKDLFSSDFISKFSSQNGESESSVKKGIDASIPSVLLGLLNNSGSSSFGSIIDLIKNFFSNPSDIASLLSSGGNADGGLLSKAGDLVKDIFGDKLGSVVSGISNYSGLKPESVNSLLATAAPATLATINAQPGADTSTTSGWLSVLNNLKPSLLAAIPAGLSLGSLGLGHLNIADKVSSVTETVKAHIPHVETPTSDHSPKKPSWSWVRILVTVAILALLYWLLSKACNKENGTTETIHDTTTVSGGHDTTNVVETVKESIKVELPNGTVLDAYKGGIEDKLVSFLKSDYKALGADSLKNIWFDFDNLNFETASAKITAESKKQIDNIVAILKAFPAAKIKIGGYTDKTGDEKNNIKLSGDRANSVKSTLSTEGVGTQVTGADGYGSKFAKFPADAPDTDKVKDRHVSVSVRL